jgi:hypothetical protein
VGQASGVRSGNQHQEDQPRAVEAERSGRRDQGVGGEDDVRSKTKGVGPTNQRRTEKTRRHQEVSPVRCFVDLSVLKSRFLGSWSSTPKWTSPNANLTED